MGNNVLDINIENECTSCGMCSAVCPKDAITMKLDGNGFYRPVIDENACISCGLCKRVCYCHDSSRQQETRNDELQCISAANRNKEELTSASSGAVSIELMRKCLELGYRVVGVAYDHESDRAVTRIAENEAQLEQFKGSKYFQSFTADAFRTVVADKTDQKYAIFGTPCQIYAFSRYAELKNIRDRYILVDIFCHGCPSMLLWDRYLENKKRVAGVEGFDQINFRSKSLDWHEFCFDFIHDGIKDTSAKYNDPFYEIFFGMDVMNLGCYDCVSRSSISRSDIRLGDFWGWQYDLDKEGVSAVVINSDRGRELFDSVRARFTVDNFEFDEIIKEQSYGKPHVYDAERRKRLLELLTSNEDIYDIQKAYRRMLPMKSNVRRVLKDTLRRVAGDHYLKLRQRNHR